jgi:hypothetical protein
MGCEERIQTFHRILMFQFVARGHACAHCLDGALGFREAVAQHKTEQRARRAPRRFRQSLQSRLLNKRENKTSPAVHF